MNKKNIMRDFIENIYTRGLTTKFIKNIFGYKNFFDHNYIFRVIDREKNLVFDIYDNVTESKFNRYIFNFDKCNYTYKKEFIDNLYIHYISILNSNNNNCNLIKLAYLLKINNDKTLEYAKTFLDNEFILILKDIIK